MENIEIILKNVKKGKNVSVDNLKMEELNCLLKENGFVHMCGYLIPCDARGGSPHKIERNMALETVLSHNNKDSYVLARKRVSILKEIAPVTSAIYINFNGPEENNILRFLNEAYNIIPKI